MILRIFLWFPLALLVLAGVLCAGPWNRLPPDDEEKARSVIVPLNVRDPSALIMPPPSGKCVGPCPSFERPR